MNKLLYEHIPNLNKQTPIKVVESHYPITANHWHEHLEIKYFLEGETIATVNNHTYNVAPGEMIIANPYEIHGYSTYGGKFKNIVLLFSPEFFFGIKISDILFKNQIKVDKYLNDMFFEMKSLSEKSSIASNIKLMVKAYEVMDYLISKYTFTVLDEKTSHERVKNIEKISVVLDYIGENYNSKIILSDLCKMTYFSEGYFCKLFRAATGKTPINYINDFRLSKAIDLLLNSNLSVNTIADTIGFEDTNYFCRIFKKKYSRTPNQYRIDGRIE